MSAPLVFCVGANHNSAKLDSREALFLSPDQLVAALPDLKQSCQLKELFVLSTCNRLELYGVLDDSNITDDALLNIFAKLQKTKPDFNKELLTRLGELCYLFRDEAAIGHMFSVCSGLDSLVLGETQITGQFKDAVQFASDLNLLGPIIQRLSQDALSVSKKIRTHTEIGKKPVSISHAAIDLANRVYGKISNHTVLIIGAGEMATVATKYAVKYQPKSLYLVNRTLEKAENVLMELGTGQAFPLERLPEILPLADIIISSTSAPHHIIEKKHIEKIQFVRNHRPLFLIDIALPRNIDPACADLDDIYLFDIDDLKQVVAEHAEERRLAAEKAKGMVAESAIFSLQWIASLNLKPALSGFREYLDDLIQREIAKTLNKEAFQNLSPAQRDSIVSLLQSVAGKISSDASARVRMPPEGFFQEQLASALVALFPKPNKE